MMADHDIHLKPLNSRIRRKSCQSTRLRLNSILRLIMSDLQMPDTELKRKRGEAVAIREVLVGVQEEEEEEVGVVREVGEVGVGANEGEGEGEVRIVVISLLMIDGYEVVIRN